MVLYNITGMANSTGYLNFVQMVNSNILNDSFGTIVLIVIFAIAFIGFVAGGFEPKRSLIGSSFIITVLAWALRIVSLASNREILWTALLLCFALAWSFYEG